MERDREAHLNYYASACNRGDNYRITRLKLNRHELNNHASLTKNTANNNEIQTKPRFGRLLRPPAWKRSGSIFWKVLEEEIEEKVRRIKKEEGKIQIGKVSKNKNTNKPHSHSAETHTTHWLTHGPCIASPQKQWRSRDICSETETFDETQVSRHAASRDITAQNDWDDTVTSACETETLPRYSYRDTL